MKRIAKIYYLALDLLVMILTSVVIAGIMGISVLGAMLPLLMMYLIVRISVAGFGAIPLKGSLFALVAYSCTEAIGTGTGVYTQAADCLEEGTGILGFYLVKKGFDLSTIIDATTLTAAKTAYNLVPVKDIEAYWPSTSEVTIPGIAGRIERLGHIEYDLPFKHEGVDANLHFWNILNRSRNWSIAFVTEEYKVFAPLDRDLEPVLCRLFAAPGGDQEFGKIRSMNGHVKWKSLDLVQLIDAAGFTKAAVKADFQP